MLNQVGLPVLALLVWLVVSYLISRALKRNDVADGMWGLGFVLLAWVSLPDFQDIPLSDSLLLGIVTFWGVRLSVYLWIRLLSKTEDPRYVRMRESWGAAEPVRAFISVFLLQGILLAIIAAPVVLRLSQDAFIGVTAFDFLGLFFCAIGLIFEVISDGEMMAFKTKSQKGQLLQSGLWRLCRHPNYFGEILVWWGIYFLCISGPLGFWAIFSPILISFLLLKVSGVPMLDQLMSARSPDFAKYAASTRALLPFGREQVYAFLGICVAMLFLDIFWLGFLMQDFYVQQARDFVRLDSAGGYDPLIWATVAVYFCIAVGIQFFAVESSRKAGEVLFRGGFFGLISYGIYEFTNLSLIKDWPLEMALVDISWGVVLCTLAAGAGHWARKSCAKGVAG